MNVATKADTIRIGAETRNEKAAQMKSVLVTGGTGTLGTQIVKDLLKEESISRIVIYSRDEYKQSILRDILNDDARLRWFIGDVRDEARMEMAFYGVDEIIHTAALKQVDAGEYNPLEFVKTNVDGSAGLINAALRSGVKRVIALSTDKASSPNSLYGATKLVSDKLFVSGNAYSAPRGTYFSVVRFGNIVGSRGSVLPRFVSQIRQNLPITVTNPEMTRFWMKISDASKFVLSSLDSMSDTGGQIFVPEIPSCDLRTLVEAIAPGYPVNLIGLRPGEKMHEEMISLDESYNTIYREGRFLITTNTDVDADPASPLKNGSAYNSENNHLKMDLNKTREYFKSLTTELTS